MRWPRLIALLVLLGYLSGGPAAWAAGPRWLSEGRRAALGGGPPVWVLFAGGDTARPLAGMTAAPVESLAQGDRFFAELALEVRSADGPFVFHWPDIAYILFYTRPELRRSGVPVALRHAPRIQMADGTALRLPLASVDPGWALSPERFARPLRRVVELNGQCKAILEQERVAPPVLAVAASREAADMARREMLDLAAANELSRIELAWDEPTEVFTACGRRTARAFWESATTFEGTIGSRVEKTKGAYGVEIDGVRYSYPFSGICRSTSRAHGPRCPGHPRLDDWAKGGAPPVFEALYAGPSGLTVFFRPEASTPLFMPSMLDVAIRFKE